MAGPTMFESAGYASLPSSGGVNAVHLSAAGTVPEDGFSCYDFFGEGNRDRGCR
jgi:hypothetical protein